MLFSHCLKEGLKLIIGFLLWKKESMIKTSVAELAGKFTCKTSFPTEPEGPLQDKPVRKRPPGKLQLPVSSDVGHGHEEQKGEVTSHPPRRNRNSALIEKLQANLNRSPTALLPSPMSPGAMKPHPAPFSPTSPCSPCTPPAIHTPSQEEVPASFETPAEGKVLQSINKGRARHSIKRRPPSRRQRNPSEDEVGAEEEKTVAPGSESTPTGASEEDVVEKQKVKAEGMDGASVQPSNSQPHGKPNQRALPDSEPPVGRGSEPCEEASASAVEEAEAEGEARCDEPQLASRSSLSTEPEPQHEGDKAVEVKEEQEERKEEEGGGQEEQDQRL
ncbi:duboraya isoform X1 [Electrophorus electricus]|uniref:duboraya isoform X1 n=1 Tax=Electrophorus electricus TaxID=8005 RepID=UPI0015D0BD41|nr:duboraya isoform X1 [Electrophorus electricus]